MNHIDEHKVITLHNNTLVYSYPAVSDIPSCRLMSSICCLLNTPKKYRIPGCFQKLYNSIVFDKFFTQSQRYTAFYGDLSYTYSGTTHRPNRIDSNPVISDICSIVQGLLPEFTFNTVLVNYYPEKSSYIPCHSDDENEILINSYITTLSLGDTRNMCFYTAKHLKIAEIKLDTWDLLIFF